ncbi:AAA family ATPase [Demequina litorisediminis]|uniref:AAA family ATPase n=1 Tax=Demequina litorisediminis TaxID=1849022 RepID=UPI0024E145F3|nr:AAA family ATPase [Demequina litorisediminis]
MLHELSIADLGVIETARIDFGAGLTCVTGETGAGKTMVLTGLGLILGAKSVPATVRAGAPEALAEAVLDIPVGSESALRLDDAGVTLDDDGTVIVARTVGATTRSRTVIGGRTVPQALLADIAGELVTVHGQSDQVRLRSSARQRDTLDTYAGPAHQSVLERYRDTWHSWTQARAALAAMEQGAEAERAEVARLRDDLAAIDALAPEEGRTRVSMRRPACSTMPRRFAREPPAPTAPLAGTTSSPWSRRSRPLDAPSRTLRATTTGWRGTSSASPTSRTALPTLPPNSRPTWMGSTLTPRASTRFTSAARTSPGSRAASASRTLPPCSRTPSRPGPASPRTTTGTRRWPRGAPRKATPARRSTRRRRPSTSHGPTLRGASPTPSVRNSIASRCPMHASPSTSSLAEASAHGADRVTFTLASHPGAPHRPLGEGASGGELSRIMLAIEVSLAAVGEQDSRTFVFDEVDAGVGGRAAIAVGNRLAELARTHQVIVVTHLAQVAAFADNHVVVAKTTDGAITRAQVGRVDGDARVEEIARLLSGNEDSSAARAHALEPVGAIPRGTMRP